MENRISKLLDLFRKLSNSLNDYFLAYKELKKCMRKLPESETSDEENKKAKMKKIDTERKLKSAKDEIHELLSKIDNLFNNGYFMPTNEVMKNEIDDSYMELINIIEAIEHSMQIPSTRNCPDIIKMHTEVIEAFNKLEGNITVYNHKAEEENWNFKFLYPEEAHKNYSDMSNQIHDNWKRDFEKRKSESFVYIRP